MGNARGGRFDLGGHLNLGAEVVGQRLHQKVVAGRAAINPQAGQRQPRVGLHGLGYVGDALAQSADPATTPLYIPALAGLAAPYWQPQARGTIFGLSRGSGRAELARATLEGLAQRVADVVQAMQDDARLTLSSLRVDGGPARNRFLMQALADNLGAEVQVAAEVESTASGIAHMARHHAHGVSLDAIAASWRAAEVYAPQITADQREAGRARWRRAVALAMEMYRADSGR